MLGMRELRRRLATHTHERELGTVYIGDIMLWEHPISRIPRGWFLCNGQTVNGLVLPDMRDRYPRGADGVTYTVGQTGGQLSFAYAHVHANTLGTDSQGAHTHSASTGGPSAPYANVDTSGGDGYANQDHTHSATSDSQGASAHTVSGAMASGGSASISIQPPTFVAAFICRVM